jgi:hypothetical protein
MPKMWSRQMANTTVEQYNNVSSHDGMVNIVP